jgi:geranylgeranyl diphosphate synthase type II
MDAMTRIERALSGALAATEAPDGPPKLAAAMQYAVFPRGARLRARLCIAVAQACGEDAPDLSDAAAAAIELLHCASLVHDDLPCFDDADTRRGKPAVHRVFGEPIAVLAGDAMIVTAFQVLAQAAAGDRRAGARLATLIGLLGRAAGAPYGIAAGQAWESEPAIDLAAYQQAKTGALFALATVAGAAASGAAHAPWRRLGERLGEAYQVADDIRDLVADPAELGKPVGRDSVLGRPSAALQLGLEGAVRRLKTLAAEAVESIPPCAGAADLQALILLEARRLLPKEQAAAAA